MLRTLLASLLLAAVAGAQSQPANVSIKFRMAQYDPAHPTSGVWVTGTTHGNDAIIDQITISNYTGKTVTSVQYGWRLSTPLGCADSTFSPQWDTAVADIKIAPGAEKQIATLDTLSASGTTMTLANEARATNTPVVLVTIGIVWVKFLDGSTWSDQEAVERNTFDNGKAEKVESCHAPAISELRN